MLPYAALLMAALLSLWVNPWYVSLTAGIAFGVPYGVYTVLNLGSHVTARRALVKDVTRLGGPPRLWIMLFVAVRDPGELRRRRGPSSRTVTFADSGKTLELGVGETLLISLDSSPGTGFDWNLSSPLTSTLELAGRTVTPSGTLLGGPATVTYRFRAAATGEATLSLGYARSWESVPPARTLELEVRVRQ